MIVPARIITALLATTTAAAARAQQPDSARADSVRRLETVTATAPRAPLPTTVGGVGVITLAPDSLRLAPSPVLADALRRIPFVLVRQNSRGENELSMRGSESRHQVVLYDGIPLTLGWDSRTDPSLIPIGGARRIAVARGLSTLLQGPNVIAGAIAVDLNRGDTDDTPGASAGVRMGLDQTGASAFHLSVVNPWITRAGKVTLRSGVGLSSRDGLALSDRVVDPYATGTGRANSDFEEIQGYLGLRYTARSGPWVGVSVSGYDATRGVPPELHLASPRLWRYPEARRTLAVFSGGLGRRATPFGSGDVEFAVALNDGSYQIDNYTTPAYTTVDGREFGDETTLTFRMEADHSFFRGEWRNAFTLARVEYRERFDAGPASDYEQRLTSLATEIDHPLAGLWRVSAGVALDAAETPKAGGRTLQPKLDAVAARLGLSTVVAGSIRLHAAASRRSRFPALRELYSGALNQFEPNPDLKPERSTGFEAGATLLTEAWQLQGLVFHQTLSDAIQRITTAEGRFQRVNRDRLRSTGVELVGTWTSAPVLVSGDLMLQHARVTDPAAGGTERFPEHVPGLRAGLTVDLPIAAGIRGNLGGRYKGTQYCVHPDAGTSVRLAGKLAADASVGRDFAVRSRGLLSHLRATLAVDNAFDAAVYDQCGLPEPGRTIRIGMTLH